MLFCFCFSPSVEPAFFCETWVKGAVVSLLEGVSSPGVRRQCESHGELPSGAGPLIRRLAPVLWFLGCRTKRRVWKHLGTCQPRSPAPERSPAWSLPALSGAPRDGWAQSPSRPRGKETGWRSSSSCYELSYTIQGRCAWEGRAFTVVSNDSGHTKFKGGS